MIKIVFSILIFIILSPLLLIVSISIYIESGFPIIFEQDRIGKNNKIFKIFKFRTMKKNTPNLATHLFKNRNDFYTWTGIILRKYSLDEIPQVLNIIKGDMNYVGPRPALYNQEDLIKLRTSLGVHNMKPGLTGLAQINGRDELSIDQKVKYDKYYYDNHSLIFDVKIIFYTITKLYSSKDI